MGGKALISPVASSFDFYGQMKTIRFSIFFFVTGEVCLVGYGDFVFFYFINIRSMNI